MLLSITVSQIFFLGGVFPMVHTGHGIPFYILIDKNGIIVDYGEHLRPSMDGTRQKISKAL